MVTKVASYFSSLLIATFTLSFSLVPSGSIASASGHHGEMGHGATTSCVQLCTSADRPQLAGKLNTISSKKHSTPSEGALIAIATLVIVSYYYFRPMRLYMLSNWRPPDRVLLSGLYHSSL